MTKQIKMKAEIKRDRWGRYLLPVPPGEDKTANAAHTRVTTIAGAIENRYHLEKWAQRMVVVGILQRKDLYAQLAGILASGVDYHQDEEAKRQINEVCDLAFEAAGGGHRATIGTALHTFTEMLDQGLSPTVPDPWDKDIVVYQETLTQRAIKHFESEVICVKWGQWAGTADRFSEIQKTKYCADLKSGADVKKFAAGSIAIQLSMYVDSDWMYNPDTGKYRPMPEDIDQKHGLVIHLPAGEAKCTLYWVDLEKGRQGRALAIAVRAWREEKGGDFFQEWIDDVPQESLGARRAGFLTRIDTIRGLGGLDRLRRFWPADLPTLKASGEHTSEQLDHVDRILVSIEKQLKAPFPDQVDNGTERHLKLVKEKNADSL